MCVEERDSTYLQLLDLEANDMLIVSRIVVLDMTLKVNTSLSIAGCITDPLLQDRALSIAGCIFDSPCHHPLIT